VCIAAPALVTSINSSEAVAEVGSNPRLINVSLTPEVKVGAYVYLRNGYATAVLSDQEAFEVLELLREISELDNDWR